MKISKSYTFLYIIPISMLKYLQNRKITTFEDSIKKMEALSRLLQWPLNEPAKTCAAVFALWTGPICLPSCQNAYRLYSAPRNKFSGFRHTLHSETKRNMKMLHIVQRHYKLINSAKHPSWSFDKIILFSVL